MTLQKKISGTGPAKTKARAAAPAKVHARLSASAAHRWMRCPASVAASDGIPDRPAGPAAELGTAAHEVAEIALSSGSADASGMIGAWVGSGIIATREMVDAVSVYVRLVRALQRGGLTGRKHLRGWLPLADRALLLEHKFDLAHVDADLGGTGDAISRAEVGYLDVWDYKHGVGVAVDATDNPQAQIYALGALAISGMSDGVHTVRVHIVQPRAPGRDAHQQWSISLADLTDFEIDLAAAAQRTRDPNAPFVPGDHCKFCKAAPTCRALQSHAVSAAAIDGANVAAALDSGAAVPLAKAATMTAEQMAARLRLVPALKAWIKTFEAHCLSMAADGNPPAGFKLVAGRGRREWTDHQTAFNSVLTANLAARADLFDVSPLSPAQLQKLIGDEAYQDHVAEHVRMKEGAPTLALMTDKRPALDASARGGITLDADDLE